MLRIYADFKSGGSPGIVPCWCLRYGKDIRPLDDVAEELALKDGMIVTLFYEDESEELEVDGRLEEDPKSKIKWVAFPDWSTYRLLRG